jgi:hypothetical protein
MVNFLYQIDNKFKSLLSKKIITKTDLLELKSFIIEAYDNDGILNIKDLNDMQKTLILDLYNID